MAASLPQGAGPILTAYNPPAFSVDPAGDVDAIGFDITASGNALLVSLVGAPVVVAVNLDLADDEVAIGGPQAGNINRQLFRGVDNTDGTSTLEVDGAGATGAQGVVAIGPAPGVTGAVAANARRRELILFNSRAANIDIFLTAGAPGAFGTGYPLVVGSQPLRLQYKGAIGAVVAGGMVGQLAFIEVIG